MSKKISNFIILILTLLTSKNLVISFEEPKNGKHIIILVKSIVIFCYHQLVKKNVWLIVK